MDGIEHSSGLLRRPKGDGRYSPWSASRVLSGTARQGIALVLQQPVATQSGAARGVLETPFHCRIQDDDLPGTSASDVPGESMGE
jgi:hypothetical protein